jgi:hypothetical protein
MRLAIIAEKPSFAWRFSTIFPEFYPDVDFSKAAVFFPCFGWYRGIRRFNFPRGLTWRDFPYVAEPSYRMMTVEDSRAVMGVKGLSREIGLIGNEIGLKALQSADQILLLMDPGSSSIHMASRFLSDHFPTIPWERTLFPWVQDCTDEGMRRAMRVARRADEFALPMISEGKMRRFFDANYLINSFALTGRGIMNEVGLRGPIPSKYSLQVLYDALDTCPLSDGQRIQRMDRWVGTGKYDYKRYQGLGTPISRGPIVQNLVDAGFLARAGKMTDITEGGRHYLKLLHPNCRDVDLPFRINDWSKLPEGKAREKMTRYLRTFFGRQKTFMDDRR